MRIALAQINTTVGDFEGNLARIRNAAAGIAADLVVFPELAVCGYMPRDLLVEPSFLDACEHALEVLRADSGLPPLVVGAPLRTGGEGKPLHNAAVLIRNGTRTAVAKRLLPTYDVFDEHRYFRPGAAGEPIDIAGRRVGFTVCEDMWITGYYGSYDEDPIADLVAAGAQTIINLSASPYRRDKPGIRRKVLVGHAAAHGVPMALCNLVGGNDQLIFDGNSLAVDATGGVCAHAAGFHEDTVVTDFTGSVTPPPDVLKEAILLGIRDYFRKTGHTDALVGMSGGVDSSLVACLAVESLGADHVTGVGMPGPFSADYSLSDARELARTLGCRFHEVSITDAYESMRATMAQAWGDVTFGVAEENMQARLRGMVLMALANRTGALVLVSSNKSELAMGYCTLYGDMVGALAPISDLYKSEVYGLARACPVPARVLDRPPSAELRPNQTDQDSLPPYAILDEILRLHLDHKLRPQEIVERGFERAVVERVLRTVSLQEYKRQQGPPVLRVSAKAFGIGRRYPIVERFFGGVS